MDTLLSTASCTKLMTSIAAMQCVERGQASLDMDVGGKPTRARESRNLD